jgi:hypothetical protein
MNGRVISKKPCLFMWACKNGNIQYTNLFLDYLAPLQIDFKIVRFMHKQGLTKNEQPPNCIPVLRILLFSRASPYCLFHFASNEAHKNDKQHF